jgi:acyl-CoA thioester hydrolase
MHSFDCRVYYEDTDLAGIVYYANYLKFIERARSEWVRGLGIDQAQLQAQAGTVFAVRHLAADYLIPARFDDLLTVTTAPDHISGARLVLRQQVLRGGVTSYLTRALRWWPLAQMARPPACQGRCARRFSPNQRSFARIAHRLGKTHAVGL